MKFKLIRGKHNIGESNYHFQLTPAYRAPIFEDEKVRNLTEQYIRTKAKQMNILLVGIGFGPDHVHIFTSNCRNYSVSKLVQLLKGYSSYMMRKNHLELFKSKLWGKKFWTSGYFYRSIGSVTSEAMRFYVEHAQEKHWEAVDYEYYKYAKGQRSVEDYL